MNDTSQMGITIAGVAVVSAIAAVVFNKLNPETRKESYARQFAEEAPRSRSRQFGEEKGEDNYYDSDEGVEPRIKNRLQPGVSRTSFGSDFDDVQEQSIPDYVEAEPNASRQSFEDDFQSPSESLSGFSQGSSSGLAPGLAPGSSSGFASGLARSSSGSSSGFAPRSSSGLSSGLSTGLAPGSSTGLAPGLAPGSSSGLSTGLAPGSSTGSSTGLAPGPSMIGGTRHTRCKHCHSRLKYTRRK
jgi:hypothetical protein